MIKAGCGDEKADEDHGKRQNRDTGSKHGQEAHFPANINWASLVMMAFSFIGIGAFVSMPNAFKLEGVSLSMENNSVKAKKC